MRKGPECGNAQKPFDKIRIVSGFWHCHHSCIQPAHWREPVSEPQIHRSTGISVGDIVHKYKLRTTQVKNTLHRKRPEKKNIRVKIDETPVKSSRKAKEFQSHRALLPIS